MRIRHRFLSFSLLPILLTALAAGVAGEEEAKPEQEKGKKKVKQEQPKLHPAIAARFRLPPQLKPTEDQQKDLLRVRTRHGAKLQLLTRRVALLENVKKRLNGRQGLVDLLAEAKYAGIRIDNFGVNSRNAQRAEIARKNKQLNAMLKKAGTEKQQLEAEIRSDVLKILTEDQRKLLGKIEAARAARLKAAKERAEKLKKLKQQQNKLK